MPKLRLPPLPPVQEIANIFSSSAKMKVEGIQAREMQKRLWLVNPTLTNRFVRELGIRKGEVIIDTYAGFGSLTRALLAGGYDETTPEDWDKVREEQAVVGPQEGSVKRRNAGQFTFPTWNVDTAEPAKLPKHDEKKVEVPSLVVCNEPAISWLSRGMGSLPDLAPPGKWDFLVPQPAEMKERINKEEKMEVYPSILEKERLVFAPESIYHWPTLPKILSHELVTKHLPVYDESKEGVEKYQRPWKAEPPHITMTSVIQDTVLGDQLLNQWVASSIGSEDHPHSWLWKWGRVRFAFLVPRHVYDEGETSHGKLSVMAAAQFKMRPLPPYHHVPNVDKSSTRTDPRIDAPRPKSGRPSNPQTIPALPPVDEVTKTVAGDYFPVSYRLHVKKTAKGKSQPTPTTPLERPALLGIELMPRDDSPIKPEQREAWDYVLRKLFVRESASLKAMLPTIAFGAENLLPKIENEGESPYAGTAVSGDTPIRNIHEKQWARIIDVFSNWAFKPDMMHYDMEVYEDSRELGQS